MIQTAKHLNIYADAAAAEHSPLDRNIQCIRGWATDLVRLSTKFAPALIDMPLAILSLIPPICPTESEVFKASSVGRKLSVVGLSTTQWDDRFFSVSFGQGRTSALCHGHESFAVGLTTGKVALYYTDTCQAYKMLDHGESVQILVFQKRPNLLASCGIKTLRIWDVRTGQILYNLTAPQKPIALEFMDQSSLVAT